MENFETILPEVENSFLENTGDISSYDGRMTGLIDNEILDNSEILFQVGETAGSVGTADNITFQGGETAGSVG